MRKPARLYGPLCICGARLCLGQAPARTSRPARSPLEVYLARSCSCPCYAAPQGLWGVQAVTALKKLNVPYLVSLPLVFQTTEEWLDSELGVHPVQVALQVASQ